MIGSKSDDQRDRRALTHGAVLVVDDHPLFRNALIHLVQRCDATHGEILGAPSAEADLDLCAQGRSIRLILLDDELPGMSGVEAISMFRQRGCMAPIVVLSGAAAPRKAQSAQRAGACAFICKRSGPAEVAALVQRALSLPRLDYQVLADWSAACTADPTHGLSARQQQVLGLLSLGLSNKEIGRRLGLAEISVKVHVSALLKALGAKNRTQAALIARESGSQLPAPGPIVRIGRDQVGGVRSAGALMGTP